jgi:hypothetical protein
MLAQADEADDDTADYYQSPGERHDDTPLA